MAVSLERKGRGGGGLADGADYISPCFRQECFSKVITMTDFSPYFAVFQIIIVLFIYLFLDYSNFQTFKLDHLAIKLRNINFKIIVLLLLLFCV